jgi:toxin YoeB
MEKLWTDQGWADYLCWQTEDKKTLKKINKLIIDIELNGERSGSGKPEPRKHEFSGWWSREIDKKNRIVYRINNEKIEISQCKGHYNDK